MRHLPGRKLLVALVVAVLTAGVAGSIAYATGAGGTNNSGTVTVCVKQDTRKARFINSWSKCRKSEIVVLLQAAPSVQPLQYTVRCDKGQKLGALLDQIRNSTQPVTVAVYGNCAEQVQIYRDNVTLKSGASGAGIRGVGLYEVRGIELSGLAIGSGGLRATAATFHANAVHANGAGGVWLDSGSVGFVNDTTVAGATGNGVMLRAGSSLTMNGGAITGNAMTGITVAGAYAGLWNVEIENNGTGVEIQFGGRADLHNCTVEQNAHSGVHTFDGGEADIGQALIQGNGQAGVIAQSGDVNLQETTIRANENVGVMGINGARVTLQGATVVEQNHGGGLALQTGSSVELQGSIVIRQNTNHGVYLQDNGVASSSSQTQVVDNGGWGVWCDSANALIRGFVGVSGNSQGQIGCEVVP